MPASNVALILKDLIAFKSISKQSNADIIDYLEHFLRPLGFDMVRIKSIDVPDRFNLLCQIGPAEPAGLMLSGHTDVVPVDGQNWLSDPFCLSEKDGRLIGRGTADMKGFIASTLCALKTISFDRLKQPLTLLWTYDEEVGCFGSQQAAPLLKEHLNYLPEAALIGEPTDFNILRMHAGHVTVRVHAKGKGAHSSDPTLGISAIKAINSALNGLFALEEELKQEISLAQYFKRPYVMLNVGEIHGGTAVNIVPDEASLVIGFRPLPDTSVEVTFDRIREAISQRLSEPKAKLTATIERSSPPMITKEGGRLEQILRPLAKSEANGAAQYSTDGGNLSQVGIECLVFGPGTIDVAHQANEWILQDDLEKAVDKIRTILHQWF